MDNGLNHEARFFFHSRTGIFFLKIDLGKWTHYHLKKDHIESLMDAIKHM